jgi:hypothetical protein
LASICNILRTYLTGPLSASELVLQLFTMKSQVHIHCLANDAINQFSTTLSKTWLSINVTPQYLDRFCKSPSEISS